MGSNNLVFFYSDLFVSSKTKLSYHFILANNSSVFSFFFFIFVFLLDILLLAVLLLTVSVVLFSIIGQMTFLVQKLNGWTGEWPVFMEIDL